MSLREALVKGDWVRAEAKSGSVIEGQAGEDMARSGSPQLSVLIADDSRSAPIEVTINVNHWDVQVTRRNIVGRWG